METKHSFLQKKTSKKKTINFQLIISADGLGYMIQNWKG